MYSNNVIDEISYWSCEVCLSVISNNEKISAEELDELKKLQKEFEEHISTRTLTNKKDKDLFISTEKL